jgi:hypothetical protein
MQELDSPGNLAAVCGLLVFIKAVLPYETGKRFNVFRQ